MSRVSRNVTRKKVADFLENLKRDVEVRDITNLKKEAEDYKLNGSAYSVMLRAMEVVKKENGTYIWNNQYGSPDAELVETLIDFTSAYQNA